MLGHLKKEPKSYDSAKFYNGAVGFLLLTSVLHILTFLDSENLVPSPVGLSFFVDNE